MKQKYLEVNMKKKIISLMLAFIMLLGVMLPGAALADTVSVMTPESAQSAELKWKTEFGSDWQKAPSAPAVVPGGIAVMSGSTLYLLDPDDGSISASAQMQGSPSYGASPVKYADGLLIAALGKGTIQAFDAKTLESKWVYTDALAGQSLSPVTYSDGKLYTGFWNGEKKDANFVCLDAATGKLNWSYTVTGGFYWAGAVTYGDYVLVGTDDGAQGASGDSKILSFKKTYAEGEEILPVSGVTLMGCGDVRSGLSLDGSRAYFTTKGGYVGYVEVSEKGELSGLKTAELGAQSTSTPVVYGSYLYFGAGSGINETGSKGNFVAADKNSLKIVKAAGLAGYPQCEMLLSTAYAADMGYLYFYSTYNAMPGGIVLIKVKADDPKTAQLEDIYDAGGYEQYCTSGVVSDNDGNIYYKNNSNTIFCIGTKVKTAEVSVSIADKGSVELSYAPVTASDVNRDGTVDINEVLLAAHDRYYTGGSEHGYAAEDGYWGLSLAKLWGETSGNFGYFVDNKMAGSLSNAVSDGAHVYAYITANAYPNNDAYAYFESVDCTTYAESSLLVKLKYQSGYDEEWNPVFSGCDNAKLTAYKSDLKTLAEGFSLERFGNGGYSLSFKNAGTYFVVATADDNAIVPAVCRVTVNEKVGFDDVLPGSFYYDAVIWGCENKIVNGMTTSTFAPDENCTRAQIVTMLYRLDGAPKVSGECSFPDAADAWFTDAVIWATEKGITKGTDNGNFAPDAFCTRGEAITMLHRYLGGIARSELTFSDVTNPNAFYYDAVNWAASNGISKGYPDGTFRPDNNCTRAEIITLIYGAAA